MTIIYSGDTAPIVMPLKIDSAVFPVLVGDTVKAIFADIKTKTAITAEITCIITDASADWAAGKVAVLPPSIESVKLESYVGKTVLLIVQVDRTGFGKKEWQEIYTIKKGYIA